MRFSLTERRLAVLEAIHENGEATPSAICHATDIAPGDVRRTLELFLRLGWVGQKPHPTRKGVTAYHLTPRGRLGAGLQPKDTTR